MPLCAVEYRRLRRCAPVADRASPGRAGVVKLRWFVERTCCDFGARSGAMPVDARHRDIRIGPRQQAAHSCALVISAQHSRGNSTSQRRSSGVSNSSIRRRFCDQALALMNYKREFLPSVSGCRGRPSNRRRSCLEISRLRNDTHLHWSRRAGHEPDWCDAPLGRRHRFVFSGAVRQTAQQVVPRR